MIGGYLEKDRIVFVKDILGAIPVMDIPINNQNFANPMFLLSIPCSDCRVIKNAKAHTLVWGGVVTGRAAEAKRMTSQVGLKMVDCMQGTSRGPQGDLP